MIRVYAKHNDEVAMPVPDGMQNRPGPAWCTQSSMRVANGITGSIDSNQNMSDRNTDKYSVSKLKSGNHRELKEACRRVARARR